MKYSELLNYQGYIYLNSISEPQDNSLIIDIDRTITNGNQEYVGLKEGDSAAYGSIEVDETLPIIRAEFDWYIAYSVTNESFSRLDEYEVFEGGAFTVYSKSRCLDFIDISTIASYFHPGPFKHYGINALNHIIDVVSTEPPTVSLIHRPGQRTKKVRIKLSPINSRYNIRCGDPGRMTACFCEFLNELTGQVS